MAHISPPSGPPLPLKFLEHVMANLVRIHIQSFPSEKIHSFTPLIYIVYFYMYKQTMNNVQLINALHKLLFRLLHYVLGFVAKNKNDFHLNHLQAILFQYHAAKSMTWGARILS